MPTLKSINAKAGTNFRRTSELVAALRTEPMQHFQVKVSEHGQLLIRAPDHPEIVGFLWRFNKWGLKNATGYFGQAALFPSAMDPALNPFIEYRIGGDYYAGTMPDLAPDEYGEYPPAALVWQDVPAEPLADPSADGWYQLDVAGEPMPTVSEYDAWILDDTPPEPDPTPDLEYAQSVRERRQAIEAKQPYLSVANAAAEMGFTPDFLAKIEAGEVVVEDWHKDNIERILNAWAWVLEA